MESVSVAQNVETHDFKSEARQLLDLMIHSLYSHKEIFLRELISNSSDALDRRRFAALTDKSLESDALEIRLEIDAEARTLSVVDNGIGMSREDVRQNLGTIAHSGTREFVAALADGDSKGDVNRLIGQFGVGFYSSFMAADEVTVVTRKAGEGTATRWHSTGDGRYTLEDAERDETGTTVTLHLRDADPDNGLPDFANGGPVRTTVKKYSDFVTYPIMLEKTVTPVGDDDDGDEGEDKASAEPSVEWETLNSMKAIWTRPQSEVGDEEYAEFYKHIAHDWEGPAETIAFKSEGTFEYASLLFIPSRAPFDLYYRDTQWGLQLYVNRVMIMERCEDLLPVWLRFMRGVVESPDLSLNVSREILQQDRRVAQIRKRIVKKVLDALTQVKKDDFEKYTGIWKNFGRVIKEGVANDFTHGDKIHDLLIFESTHDDDGHVSLADYVGRMKDGQESIYYISGESRDAVARSPHLEAFADKGYEVLFFTDPVDEIMLGRLTEFDGKKLQSVGKGDVELGTDEEKKQAEGERAEQAKAHASLLDFVRTTLEEHVKEVRLSSRLTSSAACLVGDEHDMSPHFERMLKQMQQEAPNQKRILEINPKHPLLGKMQTRFDADGSDPVLIDDAHLLYGQALLAEGSPLPDASAFSQRVVEMMVRAG